MSKVVVIGGGAAGMMAAYSAAQNGHEVILFEHNEKLGKKIYITGKGRCNVCNDCDAEDFFANVVSNPKFLYSAFYGFDNHMLMEMIEENGCRLKVERGNRVFPVSDHSSDIISAFVRAVKNAGVTIKLNSHVTSLVISEGRATGVRVKCGDAEETIAADKVIVATGGKSYPSTGSRGDGYKWALDSGHEVVTPKPALVPFDIKEAYVKDLQGLSLKNVGLKMIIDGKQVHEDFGEMIFTHFGVSGPLILSASSYFQKHISKLNRKDETISHDVKLKLDLKTALSEEQLDKRIIRDFEKLNNKIFANALSDLLPSKLIPVIIELTGIDPHKKVNLVTREERQRLVKILKEMNLTVLGTREFNEAIITQGGISTKNINPSSMESKIISGLYFCGEVIDVDALTGGFNLQIAFSSGHLAGLVE